MIKFSRKKPFNLINSIIYRFNKIFFLSPKTKFKIYANLEWIFNRLALEEQHKLYKDTFNICRNDYLKFLKLKININDNILDVGCSTGINTEIISRICNKIIGVDHSKDYIVFAKKNYSKNNIRFINDDVFNFLKENVENFDSVVCSHLIEHLDEPELFLKKISEYTNLVFIEVPDNESNYLNLIRKDQNISLNYSDDDHIYEFDRESLKKIFTRCNFKVEHEEYKFGIMRFWIKKII